MRLPALLTLLLGSLLLIPAVHASDIAGGGMPGIDASRLKSHIEYLSSDALEGRMTGQRGCEQAAGYIAGQMQQIGLEPMGDKGTWYDNFSFTSGSGLGAGNRCHIKAGAIETNLITKTDWTPMFFSPNASIDGPVVFAGYGITAPQYKWDDYAELNVRGKIVIILRFEPGRDDDKSPFAGRQDTRFSDPRMKAIRAKEAGAKAVVIVNGTLGSEGRADSLLALQQVNSGGDVGIPVIQIKRRHIDTILSTVGLTVENLQESMDAAYKPVAAEVPDVRLSFTIDLQRKTTKSANVVGMLSGNDPKHAHEVIIVGAHYDHLGYGGEGVSLSDKHEIHNGADDNASGVAGVLELARLFALDRDNLKRSICFVAFSGEELGLLGSNHFAKEPPFPLKGAVAMLNMDMIGRLNANQALIVMGLGTAADWGHVVDIAAAGLPLVLKKTEDGVGPSDQTSFVAKEIPVLSLFTGAHDDYHKPTDDADKINYPGEVAILNFAWRILDPLAKTEYTPKYQKVKNGLDTEQGIDTSRGFNVYLGTIPDYAITDKLILQGVREGGPGYAAGLRAGDHMIKFGTIDIGDVYDYTYALQTYQPGDEVDIVVIRAGSKMTFHLTLVGKTDTANADHVHAHSHGHFGAFGGEL